MQTDHMAFVFGCALVLGCCAESAWTGFRDGLRGLTPLPTWTEEAIVVAELDGPPVSGESDSGVARAGLPEIALLAE